MKAPDRARLRENLESAISGSLAGIGLDTPFHSVIEDVIKPAAFFEALPILMTTDAVLYFEGCGIGKEAERLYINHRASNTVAVTRDTLFPDPKVFHVAFSPDFLGQLKGFDLSQPLDQMFDHIKAYRDGKLLFTFHDAFSGSLLISEHLDEEAIERFCRKLGVSRKREKTQMRDPEVLRQFVGLMDRPEQVVFKPVPWWKRIWNR